MPRVVKSAEARRDEIVSVARGLFMARGYERTSIQGIIDEVGIAKGTFYHHFRSKEDLLAALVDHLRAEGEAIIAPIVEDPSLDAPARLRALFTRIGAWKTMQRDLFADIGRVLYAPANAALLARLTAASLGAIDPQLERIVREGVASGVFRVADPVHAARIVARIAVFLSEILARRLVDGDRGPAVLAEIRATCAAYHEAAERVLGAPSGSLVLVDGDTLAPWFGTEAP